MFLFLLLCNYVVITGKAILGVQKILDTTWNLQNVRVITTSISENNKPARRIIIMPVLFFAGHL